MNMSTDFMTKTTKEHLQTPEHESYGNSQEIDEFTNLYNENLISVSALTDIGMSRSRNEDSFSIADLTTGEVALESDFTPHRIGERGTLLVVADGMGGAAAGKLASEMTVAALRQALLNDSPDLSMDTRLANATELANRQVYEYATQNPEFKGMGTTLTAILVQNHSASISQVGDSRAYLIRDEKIHQLTKDQTLVQKLLDDGYITPQAALNYSRHVILQAVGTEPTVDYALAAVKLYHNDYLLLCSDGLSSHVSSEEMLQAVQNSATLPDACNLLVDLANERGGEDNITVVIARLYEAKLQSSGEAAYGFDPYSKAA
jgi:serine/threonine protein phosphatase PrpC